MNKLRTLILTIATVIGLAVLPFIPVTVSAQSGGISGGSGSAAGNATTNSTATSTGSGSGSGSGGSNNPIDSISGGVQGVGGKAAGTADLQDFLKTIVNILLFILGAIAVIMIIIGGIRYTTSNGDAQQTKAAKDTVLYAVVGLVVAILAYAIVNFVLGAFSGGTGGSTGAGG